MWKSAFKGTAIALPWLFDLVFVLFTACAAAAEPAAETGTMAGILFHQGESDSGQRIWLDKVSEMVTDLHTGLG